MIHPTAIVDDDAQIGSAVKIGPGAIVGPNVRIGDRCEIGPRVLIERDTTVGQECRLFHAATLGTEPQDLKFEGEEAHLWVGDRTVIREFATLNRGTADSGETRVGSDCLLMAYSHVAHDCVLGDNVILSNAVTMAGHVVIDEWAIVSGLVGIHQFVHIGAHAFVGGGSGLRQDVPPFCRVAGMPAKLFGINSVGLARRDFPPAVRKQLKRAYRIVIGSEGTVAERIQHAAAEVEQIPEVKLFLDFIRESERGIPI